MAKKRLGLITSKVFEEYGNVMDTFALPVVRKRQENFIRDCFKGANEIRRRSGLPTKKFRRLDSKGLLEVIE